MNDKNIMKRFPQKMLLLCALEKEGGQILKRDE